MFSIVIVTWNNFEQCYNCIKSIKKKSFYNHEIIVHHNEVAAGDRKLFPGVENMFSNNNIGLSIAANIAAKIASNDYICLIDDDMCVCEGWDIGLVKAREETRSNWVSSTMIEPVPGQCSISMRDYLDGVMPEKWYINISSTPLIIPTLFWKDIGGYDETFPVIGAELGLAVKAYNNGERLFLQTPYSSVIHNQSQSICRLRDVKERRKLRDYNFEKKYNITRKNFIKLIGKGCEYDSVI